MKYLITYYFEGSGREVETDDYNVAWEVMMALEAYPKIERVVIQQRKSGFHPIYESKPKKRGE